MSDQRQRREFIIEAVRRHDAGDSAALDLIADLWAKQASTIHGINSAGRIGSAILVVIVALQVFRWLLGW